MLKIMYSFFLGIILAVFVGVGISTFYNAPEYPEYPASLERLDTPELTEEQKSIQTEFDTEVEAAEVELDSYNRNVSILATIVAVLFMAIGLVYAHKIDVIADGILLGGIFTLLYGLGRGLASGDEIFRFLVVTVGVAAAIGIGYWRFVKNAPAKS